MRVTQSESVLQINVPFVLHICPAGEKATIGPVARSQLLSNTSITDMHFTLIFMQRQEVHIFLYTIKQAYH